MGRVSLNTLIKRSNNNMDSGTHPVVRETALEVIKRAYKEGINAQISEGNRSYARQNALYAQGRTKAGNIVTNARGGQSWHNFGIAVDFFLTTKDGNTAVWNVNRNWRRVAQIGKNLGFEWGGDWKGFVDNPHLQMTGGYSLSQLRAGKKPNLTSKVKNPVKPSKPSKPSTSKPSGGSVVDYMNRNKMNSSFANRKVLATKHGISNYKGTASQNSQLLAKLKSPSKPSSSGGSVVDYMNKNNMNASYSNRKKLASRYGISGYTGTASQNNQLLSKLKGGSSPKKKSIGQMATEVIDGKHGSGNANRRRSLGISSNEYIRVRAEVNKRAGGKTSNPRGVSVGDTVTTRTLFTTESSSKNQRRSPIKGYVADIKSGRRNEIRLRSRKGGSYLGFTRKKDIV